jgi:site-specific DNA-methyltransferase (cytosine-N4-specific)
VSTARFIVGNAYDVLASLPDGSVDCLITSPPYPWQRSYLPPDHPDKDKEIGQEADPGEALGALLRLMDAVWPVLTEDATFWVNLGDVHAGSGGSGGDYDEGGMREGQARYDGTAAKARANGDRPRVVRDRSRSTMPGWPREQSVCFIPHLFGASLAYGRNLLTGEPCRQWVVRPPVTWCKPSPSVGALKRRFRSATELIIYGGKHQAHYFDLDAVRTPHKADPSSYTGTTPRGPNGNRATGGDDRYPKGVSRPKPGNPNGVPPFNWWVIDHPGYSAAHFATFPPELILRPVLAGCPAGGTILDPFAGSGTTGAVATGNGRNALLIDLDERNADLARNRVGMFLTIEQLEIPA